MHLKGILVHFGIFRSRQIGRTISHQSQDSDLDSVTTEDDNQTAEGRISLNNFVFLSSLMVAI